MNIPNLDQINTFIANAETAVQTFTASGSSIGDDVKAALPLAGSVLDAFFPGLTVAGFSPSKVIATITDLASAKEGPATPLSAAFDELKAAVSGGPEPTAAAWAQFNTLADQKHADWKAALASA